MRFKGEKTSENIRTYINNNADLSNEKLGNAIGISANSVRSHRAHITMGTDSRTNKVVKANKVVRKSNKVVKADKPIHISPGMFNSRFKKKGYRLAESIIVGDKMVLIVERK